MTDKEKIRAEIERLKDVDITEFPSTNWLKGRNFALVSLEVFIDSMQEEPTTSVWHDANILPSNPKAVIVEHNEYSTSICRAEQMSRIKGAKWAYVEDLLKL